MKVGLKSLGSESLYREYKRRVNVREVLDHYGAENCRDTLASDGTTEILHSCLLDRIVPHHKNGDRNPSACANLEKKTYICYSYAGMDIFHFIRTMEGKDNLGDIIPVVGDFLDGATSTSEDFNAEVEKILSAKDSLMVDLPEYSLRILEPWSYSHPYIRERGVTLDASSKLQIGYDPNTNRIVFPHFWAGKLVGWQQRAIPPDPRWPATVPQIPKYRNSSGLPRSETLYGTEWLEHDGKVVVVESPMSVAKAHSLGFTNTLATFGSKVTQIQIDYLKTFPEVTLWFDADYAGQIAERNVGTKLYRHTNVKLVVPEEGKDMGDYDSAEGVSSMIRSAVPAALVLSQWDKERRDTKKKGT